MNVTLYVKDSKSYIREWSIEVVGSKYRTVHGMMCGTKVASKWTVCAPKNVGRTNETSPDEQALLEARALVDKKITEQGYKMSIEDVEAGIGYFEPMLAQNFALSKCGDFKNVYAQPKLDGIRCVATKNGLTTRSGKPIVSCPHVIEELKDLFLAHPNLILDGELYNHLLKDDFNEISSIVRKSKPSDHDLAKSLEFIEYHVYDATGDSLDGKTFSMRHRMQARFFEEAALDAFSLSVVEVETLKIRSLTELDTSYGRWTTGGYEGQIVRIDEMEYEVGKRSYQLLKRKTFKDKEFDIVDIEEGSGNRSGMAGRVVYRLPTGGTFGSGIRGNIEFFKQILKDKSKYRSGTVRFFDFTPGGVPRFPVTTDLHEGLRSD